MQTDMYMYMYMYMMVVAAAHAMHVVYRHSVTAAPPPPTGYW